MKRFVATALLLLSACIFHPIVSRGQDEGAVVTISASARSAAMKGYGIIICLTNLETGEEFESHILGAMSKNAVIEDLPAGHYIVTFAEIYLGDMSWSNESAELQDYFGEIRIDPGRIYYLGTHEATFKGKLTDRKIVFSFKDLDIPKKIIKYLDKQGYRTDDIIIRSPLEDSFVFEQITG